MTYIRVVAAVVDTRQLTIYKEDGTTIRIPQGDHRIVPILDAITDTVSRGLIANLDPTLLNANANDRLYQEVEEQTKGFARFFRVAKSKLSLLFGSKEEGILPDPTPAAPIQVIGDPHKLRSAISDIMAHAVPSSHMDFSNEELRSDETIIAAVGTEDDFKIIPGMESLEPQFRRALKIGSMQGVENFLRRLSAVIDQRGHSIMELLHFMERGDLPIADDGSILAYKALTRAKSHNCEFQSGEGVFFDIHSKMVPQRVGSFVCMSPDLVDLNRRTQCSTGLHVARRGYLRGFRGDVCVLIKIRPEDVLAVPHNEPDKMRVCGYHIIFQVTGQDYEKLLANRPMTDNGPAQKMLGKAIRGEHIGIMEKVEIAGSMGTKVTVTQLSKDASPMRRVKPASPKKAEALPITQEGEKVAAEPVDPNAIAKKVATAKAAATPTRTERATQLYAVVASNASNQERRQAAIDLLALKKTSKIGWAKLGIAPENQSVIEHIAQLPDDPKSAPAKKVVKAPAGGNRANQARALYAAKDWQGLHAFKRKAKVGWSRLGFNAKEEKEILRNV